MKREEANIIQDLKQKLAVCDACCKQRARDAEAYKDALKRVVPALQPGSAIRVAILEEFPELEEAQVIHHKDGDPTSHDLDNLEVMARGTCEICRRPFVVLHVLQKENGAELHVCSACLQ